MKIRALIIIAGLALSAPAFAQETRSFTDDLGRTVEIPVNPERIVSLHDLVVTVPLIELGLTPVGSYGRTGPDGGNFIRGAETLTGVDFANSEISYLGGFPADIEAVAATAPDLILTTTNDTTPLTQLEAIAPTLVLEDNMRGDFVTYSHIAAITGTQDRLDQLERRYQGQVAQIRSLTDTGSISVAVIGTQNGEIVVWHTYGAVGKVLRDAGFRSPDIINAIEGSDRVFFSAEELQAFDADFILTTYDMRAGVTPEDVLDSFEDILPGFCQHLHACRNNQFIMLPREDAVTRSYTALGMMASAINAIVAGRDFVPLGR